MSVALLSASLLSSCQSTQMGTIKLVFDSNVSFVDSTYNSKELKGPSGTKIENGLPDVKQDGYYFVGWREKDSKGNYRAISKLKDENSDSSYYYYPYGTDVLYPYFEKEVKITFDIGSNATLVAPATSTTGYDEGYVNFKGYTNKSISSTNLLPTAKKEHSKFQYWYTTKKIIKENNEEGGGYHYTIDQSSANGIYQFDLAFGTDNMKFLDSDFTLHAYWDDDPYVTINFGLDGVSDYRFQAYDEFIGDKIKEGIKSTLGVDYTDDGLFYKTKKLAGLYLDKDYKKSTQLNIKVTSNEDITLYMRWVDKISVRLDFNGGTFNGNEDAFLDGYYIEDTISKDVLDGYVPVKENATFTGWKLDGKQFIAGQTKLESDNIVLKAIYDDNPALSISYIYPLGYEGSLTGTVTHEIKVGQDFTSYITDMMDASLLEEGERFLGVYQATNSTQDSSLLSKDFVPVTSYLMPHDKATYYISIGVDESVTMKNVIDGVVSEGTTKRFSNSDTVSLSAFMDNPEADDGAKIFDGVYSNIACTDKINADRNGTTYALTDREHKYYHSGSTIYRKMTTGVLLSFKTTEGADIGEAYFIPGKKVLDNEVKSRMKAKFPTLEYTRFYEDASCSREITTIPNVAKTIYVK